MKRKCIDPECNKIFIANRKERKYLKTIVPISGDENLCPTCLKDVISIAYEQSYFGSIGEWGV